MRWWELDTVGLVIRGLEKRRPRVGRRTHRPGPPAEEAAGRDRRVAVGPREDRSPAQRARRRRSPSARSASRFWDGTELPATAPGPRFTRALAARRRPRAATRPGQLGLGRAYVSGELEVDDIDATLDLLQHLEAAAAAIAPTKARLALAAARAMGLERPPQRPAVRARARGAPALDRARPALGAPPLRPAGRVLRALPRRVDDLQLRDLLARGQDARGGPGDQARARVHEARPAARASACSTSAAAGAASRVHAAVNHGVHVTGITLSEPQAERARARAEEAGVADRVDIRVQD